MSDRNRVGRRPENHYCGMLIIRKEPGYTSSDVVAKLRGILHMRRIGHTGTLDPMAEGVLPVCLGNATKVTDLIADRDKEYVACLRLGVTTDTQDMTGTVLEEKSADEVRQILCRRSAAAPEGTSAGTVYRFVPDDAAEEISLGVSSLIIADNYAEDAAEGSAFRTASESGSSRYTAASGAAATSGTDADAQLCRSAEEEQHIEDLIRSAAASFVGEIRQIPPMYSAVWSNGQRLYDLARKGVTVEREPRTVTITELEIRDVQLPYVTFRVVCSKGTYIRTLCEDLGRVLGTGGAMDHLLRTRVGTFTLEEALTLDEVQNLMTEREVLAQPQEQDASCPDRANTLTGDCIENHIVPVDQLFAADPQVHVRDEDLRFLRNGNALSGANTVEGRMPRAERIRVYDAHGEFYALYRYEKSRRRALPVKMFHDTESVQYDL